MSSFFLFVAKKVVLLNSINFSWFNLYVINKFERSNAIIAVTLFKYWSFAHTWYFLYCFKTFDTRHQMQRMQQRRLHWTNQSHSKNGINASSSTNMRAFENMYKNQISRIYCLPALSMLRNTTDQTRWQKFIHLFKKYETRLNRL